MRKILLTILLLLISLNVYPAAATMYVTVAGAGSKDGSSWANAFGYSEFETDYEGSTEAGDIYYIAGGTYTLTSNLTYFGSGTDTAPIQLIGVKSGTTNQPPVLADYAYGTDRPLFDDNDSGYGISIGYYYRVESIRIESAAASCLTSSEGGSILANLKVINNANISNYYTGISLGSYDMLVLSEIKSAGIALSVSGRNKILNCYIHDSDIGTYTDYSNDNVYIGSIIESCTDTGVYQIGYRDVFINNVFYNNGTAISGSGSWLTCMNNIFDANTTGVSLESNYFNLFDYNVWDNTTDVSNVTKGLHSITVDPSMTNPASGDFTVGSGSNCLDAGAQIGTNQGVIGDYKWNIGTDQDDNKTCGASFFNMGN